MKRKIFATYAILLLMGTMITGLLSLSFTRITYVENLEKMLTTNGSLINGLIEEKLMEQSIDEIDFSNLAHKFSGNVKARVTFIDKSGVVVGDSEVEYDKLKYIENHLKRPEVQEAINGIIGKDSRYSTTVEKDYLYVAIPMIKDDTIQGITRLAYPLTEISLINVNLFRNVFISIIIGLFVAIILGYRYVDRVTEPIKQITDIAQNMTQGKFDKRVYVDSSDEVKILADTFNAMSETISSNIQELQDKNTKLKSVLSSMREGLIAIDNQKKAILINKTAMEMLDIDKRDVIGEHVENIITNQQIKEALIEMVYNNIVGKKEIHLKEEKKRILKIYSDSIKLNDNPNTIIGTLILIQDVTEMRKLEKMRTEFVANVSHELKTPLTSITGFVETLKGGAIDNEKVRGRFLDIIEIEAERLKRLINDLLTLSNIESSELSFSKKEKIVVNEVVQEIDSMMEEIAKNKDITYTSEVQENLPELYGSRDWFKQLILNLVDNAIKYTPEGGEVKLRSYKRDRDIFIVVKDTGIGIPKKDIPRLFERFYRVDKARSRKVGGTGLGLAIVKHITIAFKGEVAVKSQEKKGTEFTVRLPIQAVNTEENI